MKRLAKLLLGCVVALATAPAHAAPTLYTGTFRLFTGPGGGNRVPNDVIGPVTNGPAPDVASVMGAAPQTVALPAGQWNFAATFVNPSPATGAGIIQSTALIDLNNEAGTLMAGGGRGNFTHVAGSGSQGQRFGTQVGVAGPNRFGGVLPMVMFFGSRLRLATPFGGTLMGTLGFDDRAGAGFGYQTGHDIFSTSMGAKVPFIVQTTHGTWTTGKIVAKDSFGPAISTVTLTGADMRTSMGQNGTLQLVSPQTFNVFNPFSQDAGSSVHLLTLQFVPEPGETAAMLTGLAALTWIAHMRRRTGPLQR